MAVWKPTLLVLDGVGMCNGLSKTPFLRDLDQHLLQVQGNLIRFEVVQEQSDLILDVSKPSVDFLDHYLICSDDLFCC